MKKVKLVALLLVGMFVLTNMAGAAPIWSTRSRAAKALKRGYYSGAAVSSQLESKYFRSKSVSKATMVTQQKGLMGRLLYWLATRTSFSVSVQVGSNEVDYSKSAQELSIYRGSGTPHSYEDYVYDMATGNITQYSYYLPGGSSTYTPSSSGYDEKKERLRYICREGLSRINGGEVPDHGNAAAYVKALVILAN